GGDAELLGFRNMFATYFLEPARRLGRPFEVEAAGVEDALQRYLTHAHWQNLSVSIEAAEDGAQFLAFGGSDQVDLADQDDIGEFHLLDQQLGDRTFVLFAEGFATAGQALGFMEIAQEVYPVDHRDHGVQPRQIAQAAALLVTEGK